MKESPILFSTPMVQAILADRKTQTRRIMKRQPDARGVRTTNVMFEDWHGVEIKFPYGRVGDVLWVRETWCKIPQGPDSFGAYLYKSMGDEPYGKWKPSIHMPKSASRIWLKITDIRVERLQDIGEEDAKAEGVEYCENGFYGPHKSPGYRNYFKTDIQGKHKDIGPCTTAVASFKTLWEVINGSESWEANPWVWVISFERIEKPE